MSLSKATDYALARIAGTSHKQAITQHLKPWLPQVWADEMNGKVKPGTYADLLKNQNYIGAKQPETKKGQHSRTPYTEEQR